MPAASFLLTSIGLLPRRFLLQPASLPDPKSQGHLLSGPFVEAHQGVHPHVCPRSGFLAASCRGCARPLVAAPVVCARPSAAVPQAAARIRACLLVATSQLHDRPVAT